MITKLETFIINTYNANVPGSGMTKVDNKTTEIDFFLDFPSSFISEATHISCTSLFIPKTWFQVDESDSLLLNEGDSFQLISYSPSNYETIEELANDLQIKLISASSKIGNNYIYKCSSNIIHQTITIECLTNDNKEISIITTDTHMRILYGLKEKNNFELVNDKKILTTGVVNLKPINQLFLKCDAVTSFNSNGFEGSNILATFGTENTTHYYSLKANMKKFSGKKNLRFSISDFDNEIIDLYENNWTATISLFKYEEIFLDKLKMIIDYQVLKDQIGSQDNYSAVQNY